MSRRDYVVARQLVRDPRVTFTALIMAAIIRSHDGAYKVVRDGYKDIWREYWDRAQGINGFVRGEDKVADRYFRELDERAELETNGFRLPKT